MQNASRPTGHRSRLAILACLIVLAAMVAPAKDGRDFAGFYAVNNVTDLGEEVRVTLTVRVYNYSDADVTGATITLEDSLLPDKTYGSFTLVSIRDRESVRLSGDFTIPRREYDQWQEGDTPQLRIEFKDAAGNTVERLIELAPMPVEEE